MSSWASGLEIVCPILDAGGPGHRSALSWCTGWLGELVLGKGTGTGLEHMETLAQSSTWLVMDVDIKESCACVRDLIVDSTVPFYSQLSRIWKVDSRSYCVST